MKTKFFRIIFISVLLITLSSSASYSASGYSVSKTRTSRGTYEIIIAGAGTGGISAAIQAARMGVNVLVVEPGSWIGGQATAAGVSNMDDMSRQKSGIYEEFITRVKNYYDSRGKSMGTSYWTSNSVAFEPRIGQDVLIAMVNDARRRGNIDFMMNSNIIAVDKDKRKVTGVTVQLSDKSTRKYTCKVLIDATEYGDILPLAKTQYRIGNSTSKFPNPDSMIQDITWTAVLKKYPAGVPNNLRPISPLPGYELAKRNYESFVSADGFNFRNKFPVDTPVNFATHNSYRGLPDSTNPYNYDADRNNRDFITKTSVNWANDYPGTYSWNGRRGLPVAYIENKNLRLQIEREALIKTLHFIYYIQNELGENWSVANDEFNNRILPEAARTLPREWQDVVRHMPPMPYVRESRRIIAKHTLTSHEILQNSLSYRDGQTSHEFSDAIAIGGYILDLHGANTDADMEWEFNERSSSSITNRPRGPFQVPMNILIPEDTDGLIAAEKNISASRLAAGALRLQPITMMTGQAAGALAALCVKENKFPKDIQAIRVQWELLNSDVDLSLCHYSDIPEEHPVYKSIQISNMHGLIPANEYPHVPSFNLSWIEDPVIAMTIIRGADKGIFGVNDMITKGDTNGILDRARASAGVSGEWEIFDEKLHNFVSRGDFAKAVCDAFPMLKDAGYSKSARIPFKITKHRNSEYVNILARLGALEIYKRDSEFRYGTPVTKGEAADIVVRAAVIASGM